VWPRPGASAGARASRRGAARAGARRHLVSRENEIYMCETGALRVCCGDKLALLHQNGRLMSNGYEARAHAQHGHASGSARLYTLYHERDTAKRDKCATHDNTRRARSSAAGSRWPSHGRRRWARLVARGSLRRHEQIAAADARQDADSSRRAERTTSAHRNGCASRHGLRAARARGLRAKGDRGKRTRGQS